MPYIDDAERHRARLLPKTPGELNFAITVLVSRYIELKGLNYAHLNDALGALSGATQEFYRRVVVPYEDKKRAQNGDCYGSLT